MSEGSATDGATGDLVREPHRAVTPVVAVEGATVVLGGRAVVRGADLRVGPGEVVAVLGPNGSGKSTLVRAVVGLLPLAAGSVRLFGAPLPRFRDWRRVGYVPQRTTAASGVPATAREVVTSGRLAGRGLWRPVRRADRAAVLEALDEVGLADRADDPVAALSGGQQQRVLIARALVAAPDLLVMDEPMAGVDLHHQETFALGVEPLLRRGASMLLVAHELGPLEAHVQRAVVLEGGRVVHDGAPPRPVGHHGSPGHDHVHPHAGHADHDHHSAGDPHDAASAPLGPWPHGLRTIDLDAPPAREPRQ